MSRAEEAALKAYPKLLSGSIFGPLPVDLNKACREKYQEGYEQAEKDIALTVEDIKTILDLSFWNNDPEKILEEYNRICDTLKATPR